MLTMVLSTNDSNLVSSIHERWKLNRRLNVAVADQAAYEAEIRSWRQSVEDKLRAETGWLTLTGLYWLHQGENTLGSDPSSDILLPESAPKQVGFIDFSNDKAT